jgi:hypothetical protein
MGLGYEVDPFIGAGKIQATSNVGGDLARCTPDVLQLCPVLRVREKMQLCQAFQRLACRHCWGTDGKVVPELPPIATSDDE